MPEFKWRPIEDLPEELYSYSDPDLHVLEEEWQEVRDKTPKETLDRIIDEIKREWAIETGKIEGLYTLSKGITKTLIQYGISAKLIPHDSTNIGANRLTEILNDQQEVIEGLMDYVAQSKPLTLTYIRQMHQVFTRHQDTTEGMTEEGKLVDIPMIKGAWKKWPNNPLQTDETIHEYCPPEQVPNEMEHLLELHQKHVTENVSPEVEAAFLHHRFTQIHPFQDGNGRVARALASLVLLQARYFPFVVRDEERAEYIDALEEADQGNLSALIKYLCEKQKDLLYLAVKKSQEESVSEDIKFVGSELEKFINDLEFRKRLVKKADSIINTWRNSAEELIKLYGNEIRRKKITESSLIDNYTSRNKLVKTDRTALGSVEHPIGKISEGTFFIQLPLVKGKILLYLMPSEISDKEIILQAKLQYQNGRNISSLEISSNTDFRFADLQFRNWFQNEFGSLVEKWVNKRT